MIDLEKILLEICDDKRVLDKDVDLLESGLLDSFAFIELFSRLEDEGICIQVTRIDREYLRTVKGIQKLIEDAKEENK